MEDIKVFRDKGFCRSKRRWLPHSEWLKAIELFPRVTVDIIIMDEAGQACHLPYRIIPPKHFQRWVVGGGVLPGEGPEAAARRIFRQDTGLKLARNSFKSLGLVRCLVAGPPSFDAYVFLFAVYLTGEQRNVVVLDREEYDQGRRLEEFTAEAIKKAGLDPYVLYMFKKARKKKGM